MPVRPSEKEEHYFREQEMKQLLAKAQREQALQKEQEKKQLKELHYMHCPKCGQKLLVEKYGKVEIDVCAHCKGLWLDANELDQILAERSESQPLRRFLKVLGG
jgi:uncharacterized protein